MQKDSKLVRCSTPTYARLRRIAGREQRTLTAILDRALLAYEQAARREQAARHRGAS